MSSYSISDISKRDLTKGDIIKDDFTKGDIIKNDVSFRDIIINHICYNVLKEYIYQDLDYDLLKILRLVNKKYYKLIHFKLLQISLFMKNTSFNLFIHAYTSCKNTLTLENSPNLFDNTLNQMNSQNLYALSQCKEIIHNKLFNEFNYDIYMTCFYGGEFPPYTTKFNNSIEFFKYSIESNYGIFFQDICCAFFKIKPIETNQNIFSFKINRIIDFWSGLLFDEKPEFVELYIDGKLKSSLFHFYDYWSDDNTHYYFNFFFTNLCMISNFSSIIIKTNIETVYVAAAMASCQIRKNHKEFHHFPMFLPSGELYHINEHNIIYKFGKKYNKPSFSQTDSIIKLIENNDDGKLLFKTIDNNELDNFLSNTKIPKRFRTEWPYWNIFIQYPKYHARYIKAFLMKKDTLEPLMEVSDYWDNPKTAIKYYNYFKY